MKNEKLQALTEGAIMVALAQVLGYIKIFSLPNGGSITLNMLPIFIYCARWGFKYGIIASFVFSLLQLFLDGAYAWGWQSIIGDYLIAYTVIGIAGIYHKRKYGLIEGSIAGCVARFIVAWIVGAVVWGEYMPETFFGMTMTSPWIYSALYNGSYIFINMILCIIIEAILYKTLRNFIQGKRLKG